MICICRMMLASMITFRKMRKIKVYLETLRFRTLSQIVITFGALEL